MFVEELTYVSHSHMHTSCCACAFHCVHKYGRARHQVDHFRVIVRTIALSYLPNGFAIRKRRGGWQDSWVSPWPRTSARRHTGGRQCGRSAGLLYSPAETALVSGTGGTHSPCTTARTRLRDHSLLMNYSRNMSIHVIIHFVRTKNC